MHKRTSKWEKAQEGWELENRCWEYLKPLLEEFHRKVDRRLVKTLLDLVLVILLHRNRNSGLLLSELGDHLLGGERGPAGVKRIASLVHSVRWKSSLIVNYLWQRADEKVKELTEKQEAVYVIWDESVLEKSESLKAERLCAVRSTKAAHLKRIKPGYFNPPGGRPIFVPGFNWLQLLVTGMKGTPMLAHLHWWTTRGEHASQKRVEEGHILRKVARVWGRQVIHIWDRGFAGSPWTTLALNYRLRFILRWNKQYHLVGPDGANRKFGKSPAANVPGTTAWCGMHADVANGKQASLPSQSSCQTRIANSFWWSPVPAMDANLGTSSPTKRSILLIRPGRSFLPTLDVGKLRCPYALLNPRWRLSLRAYSIGSPA